MNDELKAKLLEMLTEIHETAKAGGNFVIGQAPDVAREIILLGRINETLYCGGGLLLAIVAIITGLLFLRKALRSKDTDASEFAGGCAIFLGGVPTVVGLAMFLSSLKSCIMVWAAPRLYLIDYIRGLL